MRHAFTRVEGTVLHWVELGEDAGAPPVVMLHGLNDSHLTWKRVAPALSRDRRVLLPDLPGHGLSERPDASYAIEWYAHSIGTWLDSIGLEQADVVGHSFGGGVAMAMLLQSSARIRRLVLVSSGGLGRDIAVGLRLASASRLIEHFGQPFMAAATRLALRAEHDVFTDEEIAALSAMNATQGSARAFARTSRAVIGWRGQRHSFFQRVHELQLLPPIAVCWGDRDAIIPFAHAEALSQAVEGIVLTPFEGCGHYVHCERPEAFSQAVYEFLSAPSLPAPRLRVVEARTEPARLFGQVWKRIGATRTR